MKRWAVAWGAVTCALILTACSSQGTSGDEMPAGFEGAAGTWTVNECSVLGPGSEEGAPSGGVGTDTVLVAGGDIPEVWISDAAQPAAELQVVDVVVGSGDPVQPGEEIEVNYCGVGLQSRAVFDSSWARGDSITFPLAGLISGWQDGLPGMQVGGRRLLVIPGVQAYGENPPPGIEPNETLIFVIDLLNRG